MNLRFVWRLILSILAMFVGALLLAGSIFVWPNSLGWAALGCVLMLGGFWHAINDDEVVI